MNIYSFPPITQLHSKVLILGTMPGKDSLKHQQYYAHPQNTFWKIMFHLFNEPPSTDYKERQQLLLNNNIALWDMLHSCKREGSLDAAINSEIPNNIVDFLNKHRFIEHLFFNGKQAEKYFIKHFGELAIPYTVLPSTSPAHTIGFENKLKEWKVIKKYIQ